jgi:Protein of unknown function (DUF3828)
MRSRRTLVAGLACAVLTITVPPRAAAASQVADEPAAIVTAIYTRVAKGKGNSGGTFVTDGKAAKTKYLSQALHALWAKADARTVKGDIGPVDFDPVTNSQDPDVKSFKVIAEKQDAAKATIAVTLQSHRSAWEKPADQTVRYDFVRENGQWKIDDFRGSVGGEPWSIRSILTEALKS